MLLTVKSIRYSNRRTISTSPDKDERRKRGEGAAQEIIRAMVSSRLVVADLATACLCSGRMRRLPVSLDFYSFCKGEEANQRLPARAHTPATFVHAPSSPIVRFIVEPRFLLFFFFFFFFSLRESKTLLYMFSR